MANGVALRSTISERMELKSESYDPKLVSRVRCMSSLILEILIMFSQG